MELIKGLQTPGWFETWEIVLGLAFVFWAVGRAGQAMIRNPEATQTAWSLFNMFRGR